MTIIEEPENKIKEEDTQHDSQIKERRDTEVIKTLEADPLVRKDIALNNNETLLRDNSGNVLKSLL